MNEKRVIKLKWYATCAECKNNTFKLLLDQNKEHLEGSECTQCGQVIEFYVKTGEE